MTCRTSPKPFGATVPSLCLLLPAVVLALAAAAPAQETAPAPQSLEDALHQLSDAAGVVFAGEVVAIRRRNGEAGASGVVEIDFHIDQAIRGCTSGSIYTLREWAGLWMGGDRRYRVGQRLLMLLHTPGAAGISSPVGGMAGAIPIRGGATLLDSAAAAAMTATTATASAATAVAPTTPPPVADLRWVGTRVLRPIHYATPAAQQAIAIGSTLAASTQNSSVSDVSTAVQQAPVSVVAGMLSSWQRTPHAAP